MNPILRTDSYKLTHFKQYPSDAEIVYSYLESRGGFFDQILFSGLQYYLRKYLAGTVFKMPDIENAQEFAKQHFGNSDCFNTDGWLRLYNKHRGMLPLRIRALPEGTVVPAHIPLITVENTDPEFPWLTNWAETLLMKVWYPTTVGTLSRAIRQTIGRALKITAGTSASVDFKLHDFGYRGVSSEESAAIGGFAHLINFMGSDTLAAIDLAAEYYGCPMAGFSIPASEHSTITSWGKEHEKEAYQNMLEKYPTGLVACVSDSYDIENAVEKIWGGSLRDKVLQRTGTLVIRPDSGDPAKVLNRVFELLWERFGGTVSESGYKTLTPAVRVIQGDGVNYQSIQAIIGDVVYSKGWSMDNLAFGMGGALLQQLNRDTLKFAFKCSAIRRAGVWHDVKKTPKTDLEKASMGGRFVVVKTGGRFHVGEYSDTVAVTDDMLETVFLNGYLTKPQSLDTIRSVARKYDTF